MSAACYSNLIAYFFDGRAPFQDSCLIRQHNKEVWWHSEDQSGVMMSKVGELGRSSGKNSQQDPLSRVFLCDCPLPSCSAVSHSTAHSPSQTLAAARSLSISCSKYLGRNCRQVLQRNLERSAFEIGDTTFLSLLTNNSALLAVVSISGRRQQ